MFLLVVAKEPVPGRAKTRLCPPCTARQAADIAAAALADTLDAAMNSAADEVVVALDGRPGPWLPEGARVIGQVDGPLDRRLAAAWAAATAHHHGPGLQIGMDTPQVTAADLDHAMATLSTSGIDAVLGTAMDGGWWAIGLHDADDRVFVGVPMSRADTGARQIDRLGSLGLDVGLLPTMRDIDDFDDAIAVAAAASEARFATEVRDVEAALTGVRAAAG